MPKQFEYKIMWTNPVTLVDAAYHEKTISDFFWRDGITWWSLEELGREGWEIISIDWSADRTPVLMKREVDPNG